MKNYSYLFHSVFCLLLLIFCNNSLASEQDAITVDTIFACQEEKDFEKMFRLAFSEDGIKTPSEIAEFNNGKCTLIKRNERVIIIGRSSLNVKVRIRSNSQTYWTSQHFIR